MHASKTVTLFLRLVLVASLATAAGTKAVFVSKLQTAPYFLSSCRRLTTRCQSTVVVHMAVWRTRRPRLVRVANVEKTGRTAVELLSKLPYSRESAAAE